MQHTQEDPVLISARREALVVFACWAIAMTWSVSYCYLNGYITDPSLISDKQKIEVRQPVQPGGIPELWVDHGKGSQRVEFVLGFPAWIFWGVALPWWICTAFSLFFGAFIVRDEDLGLDPEAAAALEAANAV